MNQRVHVCLHRFPIGQDNFRRVGLHRARPQTSQGLLHNLVRLIHLAHADHIPGPNITVRLGRNFKVVTVVTAIRICAPNIEIDSTAAQARAGQSPIDRIFCRDVAHALGAFLKDSIARDELMKFLSKNLKDVHEDGSRFDLHSYTAYLITATQNCQKEFQKELKESNQFNLWSAEEKSPASVKEVKETYNQIVNPPKGR